MRENDHLRCALRKPTHLLHGGQGAVVVEARDRIVDDDYLVRKVRVLVERRKEEGERSEEHTSELQSLMRISYAVFCLNDKHLYNTSDEPQFNYSSISTNKNSN